MIYAVIACMHGAVAQALPTMPQDWRQLAAGQCRVMTGPSVPSETERPFGGFAYSTDKALCLKNAQWWRRQGGMGPRDVYLARCFQINAPEWQPVSKP